MPSAFLPTLLLIFTGIFPCLAQKAPAAVVVNTGSYYPKLDIEIKLTHPVVHNIDDLELYVIISNKQSYPQTFLYDRPIKPGFGLWEAGCTITPTIPKNQVVKFAARAEYHISKKEAELLSRHAYTIQPHEWFARKFSVQDICVFNDKVCVNKNLPRDTYALQFSFQNNYSNTVLFTVRKKRGILKSG